MYCHILRVRAIPTLESTDSMIRDRECGGGGGCHVNYGVREFKYGKM